MRKCSIVSAKKMTHRLRKSIILNCRSWYLVQNAIGHWCNLDSPRLKLFAQDDCEQQQSLMSLVYFLRCPWLLGVCETFVASKVSKHSFRPLGNHRHEFLGFETTSDSSIYLLQWYIPTVEGSSISHSRGMRRSSGLMSPKRRASYV